MARTCIAMCLLTIAASVSAQWKKMADFGEPITCVYFLDNPVQNTVGYFGTQSSLYKTIDGAKTWTKVWGGRSSELYFVTDICFKDSLTGWFTVTGGNDACYRTQDGGATWKLVCNHPYGGGAVYFCSSTQLLFLSTEGDVEGGFLRSSDLGDSWDTVSGSFPSGISFASPMDGIVAADYVTDTGIVSGFLRTSNGGFTWLFAKGPHAQPFAIEGSQIRFAVSLARLRIWRSDDAGVTWSLIHDFGPLQDSNFTTIAPYGTACIRGDLSRLYIQTEDSGMYVSVDSGRTWSADGGPSYVPGFSNSRFYAGHGVTVAGWLDGSTGVERDLGLWMEEWPKASVAQTRSSSGDCLRIKGPCSSPSSHAAKDVTVMIHYCEAGQQIRAQIYDILGNAVGNPTYFISDGQVWDRIAIAAPLSNGNCFIRVTVNHVTATLGIVVN